MIPFPYNLIAVGLLVLSSAWGGATVQRWHTNSLDKERVEAQAETDRLAHLSNLKRIGVAAQARDRAIGRAVADRADADAARTDLERVQALSAAALGAARVSHAACLDRATAINDVFQSCTAEVGGLAAKADRHVNDVKTLSDAWPTNE